MLEVAVVDSIYCGFGFCEPLDWWSSAAAWAQAILTVLTFAGTVAYQAKQNRDLLRKNEVAQQRAEVTMARVIASREFRRWRRNIRQHLSETFIDHQAEATATIELAKRFKWEGEVRDIQLLGRIGEGIVGILSVADDMQDQLEVPFRKKLEDKTPLDELVIYGRDRLRAFERAITEFIDNLDGVGNRS